MDIIIVGCGKVGSALTEQLANENHNITVVDLDAGRIEDVTSDFDVRGVVGNGASHFVLEEAGIDGADLMIAVTHSDEVNLLCCLIAKKAGNCPTIARVRNPVYHSEIDFIKEGLGLAMAINPEQTAATEMSRVLRRRNAIEITPFAKGKIELQKFRIAEGSPLAGMALMRIPTSLHCDVLICTVERGDEVFIPNGNFILQAHDKVSFVAAPHNAAAFFKKIGIENSAVKSCMIIGGGTIAYYLAQQLLAAGVRVKIIERNRERCEELSVLLPKAVLVCADATDQKLLVEEGLPYVDAFVTATGLDEENILLSLLAQTQSDAKTITKVTRINYDRVISSLELDSIVNPKEITANSILRYVRAMQNSIGANMESLYRIIDGKAEALEFKITEPSEITEAPLWQLRLRKNILIGCISRNGKVIIPRGQDQIQVGDSIIVVSGILGLNDVRDILAK